MAEGTAHIVQSLVVNAAIAVAKAAGAFFSGSGAMLAEAIHSLADCANQLLLLLGVKQSRRAPSVTHPLGYGRVLYFWSFMVALMLFLGGGVFSVYEGLHKIETPEPLQNLGLNIGILFFALLLEGGSTLSNIREMRQRRGDKPFVRYLRETKDSDLIVVFGENSAATVGLLFALIAILLAYFSGNPMWDGVGSACIGVVLIFVALFLAFEIKSLLVGEAADPHVESTVRDLVDTDQDIDKLLHIIAIQQGPGQVLLLLKLGFRPELRSGEIADAINRLEDALRRRAPEIKWCFVEPDRPRQ